MLQRMVLALAAIGIVVLLAACDEPAEQAPPAPTRAPVDTPVPTATLAPTATLQPTATPRPTATLAPTTTHQSANPIEAARQAIERAQREIREQAQLAAQQEQERREEERARRAEALERVQRAVATQQPAATLAPTATLQPTATLAPTVTLQPTASPVTAAATPVYDRGAWQHWVDADGDCQDTRQEVLVAESLVPVTFTDDRRCRVAGGEWLGPYTGQRFMDPGQLDIDHLVPLRHAHDTGAGAWSAARKREYANYLAQPAHLVAVEARANRSKGAKGPADWRPPEQAYWCRYATDWQAIKQQWGLRIDEREAAALAEMLATCTGGAGAAPAAAATITPEAVPTAAPQGSTYASCEAAVAAGVQRVQGSRGGGRGFPAHLVPSARDGDGDGVVCEQ